MISVAPVLTYAGKDLLTRAIGGEQISFTRFKAGNGEVWNEKLEDATELKNVVMDFGIASASMTTDGFIQLSGSFLSSDIANAFIWRELGVYAKGEDGVEILYAYAYDNANANVVPAALPDVVVEQNVHVIVAIGTATNVTAVISQSAVYASKEEFDQHAQSTDNPHNVTAAQIGLGNVENVSTNNQTPTYTEHTAIEALKSGEKMSVAFGKIAKAISEIINHVKNQKNPHGTTANDVGAASKTHDHAASDINSGTLSLNRGGTGASTAEQACTNLGAAKKTHYHSASDINSGTLSLNRGGTGASTAEQARTNLGAAAKTHYHSVSDINSGTMGIERGGTGASTAEQARNSLGAAKKSVGISMTAALSAWTGDGPYVATLVCSIATATNNLIVSPGSSITEEQLDTILEAHIHCTSQGNGTITLTAFGKKPNIDLPVNVVEVG